MRTEPNYSEKVKTVLNEAWKFLSSTRGVMPNSIDSIGMIGTLLYLSCENKLFEKSSYDHNKYNTISVMDRDFIATLNGNLLPEDKDLILCTNISNDKSIYQVVTYYINELSRLEPLYVFELASTLLDLQLNREETLTVFDAVMKETTMNLGMRIGEFLQPLEISELISKLAKPGYSSVFNPFSGTLSYATACKGYTSFTGIEINQTIWMISMLRIAIAFKENNIKDIHGDVGNWTPKKYDLILTTPPFGGKIRMRDSIIEKEESYPNIALKRFEETTTSQGQLLTIVPLSVLFSMGHEKEIRRDITSKGYLDTIIMLPERLFSSTSIAVAVIYLNKNKRKDSPINMIDATDAFIEKNHRHRILDVETVLNLYKNINCDKRKSITIDEIAENEWSWYIPAYVQPIPEDVPEGFFLYSFDDIMQTAHTTRRYKEQAGHYVSVNLLSQDPFSYEKSITNFPISEKLKNTTKLIEPALLLSSIGSLRPTFCNASSEEPLFLSSDVSAYTFDNNKIDRGYLVLQLCKSAIKTTGIFPRVSKITLKTIHLAFPDLSLINSFNEQKRIFETEKRAEKMAKIRELGLQEVIDNMKAEYINEVRMRKHDMRPYMRNLASIERLMRFYLEQNNINEIKCKFISQLDAFHDALIHLSDLLEHLSDENEFGKPEKFNLDEYLYNLEINHNDNEGYNLTYDTDDQSLKEYGLPYHDIEKRIELYGGNVQEYLKSDDVDIIPLYINIAPLDFERIVHNILENAKRHGFTDSEKDDYIVWVKLSVNTKKQMFQLDFSNNGNPLPQGLDKERYGLRGEKAGITGGTGCGGSIIKNIVKHYGGDYDISCDGNITTISIYLPIIQEYYE